MSTRRVGFIVTLIAIACVGMLAFTQKTEAARFLNRSLFISSGAAGETAFYQLNLTYPSMNSVGSLRLEFCDNPIPTIPCTLPAGLDISNATLSAQTGETGFSISDRNATTLILSRTPSVTGNTVSTYKFDTIVNPSSETQDFYVRITSHASSDASDAFIDFGSVTAMLSHKINVYTQVPPILIFCVAGSINDVNCDDTEGNFVDYGELSTAQTYTSSSEILARTNAQYGYSILVYGQTMTAGVHAIPALSSPTESFVGISQFGMNLAQNTNPATGAAPSGPGTNAVIASDYNQTNKFVFRSGDIIASSNGVTPTRKFTANYIVNVSDDQRPGIYSTTISYLCVAGF